MLAHIILTLLSEKLEELSSHKKRLKERLKRFVEYKMLENKQRNGVNTYDDKSATMIIMTATYRTTPCT